MADSEFPIWYVGDTDNKSPFQTFRKSRDDSNISQSQQMKTISGGSSEVEHAIEIPKWEGRKASAPKKTGPACDSCLDEGYKVSYSLIPS